MEKYATYAEQIFFFKREFLFQLPYWRNHWTEKGGALASP